MTGLSRFPLVLFLCAVTLAACGEKKTELGQGGSVVSGSAGPMGAQNAARELVRCDAPVATVALAENPHGYALGAGYQLPASPVPLIKLLAQWPRQVEAAAQAQSRTASPSSSTISPRRSTPTTISATTGPRSASLWHKTPQ